jgi:hypothetical protein
MSNQIIVYKNRTNYLSVNVGFDVSADTITSQIRSEPAVGAPLIAEWTVTKPNGGADGELLLTLDDAITAEIAANSGYMDLKRVSGSEPLPVFDGAIEVLFKGTVTA